MRNKANDFATRQNHTGSYSTYNYLYHYLLDNYEPENLTDPALEKSVHDNLMKLGKGYAAKVGDMPSDQDLCDTACNAIENFKSNNKAKADTGHDLGEPNSNADSFKNIVNTIKSFRV
jgi:hypothetical protein